MKRIRAGFTWGLIGKVAGLLITLFTNMVLARMLTAQDLGLYFLSVSVVTVFATLTQFGLPQTLVSLVAELKGSGKAYDIPNVVRYSINISLISIFIGVISLIVGKAWIANDIFHSDKLYESINLLIIWSVILLFRGLEAEIFRGLHLIKLSVLHGNLLPSGLILLFLITYWTMIGRGVYEQAVFLIVCGGAVGLILSSLSIKKNVKSHGNGLALNECHNPKTINYAHIISIAWPIWLTNLVILIVVQGDILVGGVFLSQLELAHYGTASRLAFLVMSTSSIFYAFLPPIIAELYGQKQKGELEKTVRLVATVNSILTIPIILVLLVFPGKMLTFIYGKDYADASVILAILMIGWMVNVLTGIRGYVLMMTGFGKSQMWISLVGGGGNLVFCSIGAHYYGALGLAMGFSFAMSIQCFMELIMVRRSLGIWTHLSLSFLNVQTLRMLFENIDKKIEK